MDMFTLLYLIVAIIALLLCWIFYIKNNNTYRNHMIIADAIHSYIRHCIYINAIPLVDYMDEEPYEKTLFRIWDWGYTRILPPEKFEIIRPFIGKEIRNGN